MTCKQKVKIWTNTLLRFLDQKQKKRKESINKQPHFFGLKALHRGENKNQRIGQDQTDDLRIIKFGPVRFYFGVFKKSIFQFGVRFGGLKI